jgi:hypothetical protein
MARYLTQLPVGRDRLVTMGEGDTPLLATQALGPDDPEVGSATVPGTIARALSSHGHQVDVLTGLPNYPTGRLYPGYRLRRGPVHRACELRVAEPVCGR